MYHEEAIMNDTLRYKIHMLPDSPGCYLMKSGGNIIYVGKAVNLKNRVRSYFHGEHTPKVEAMVGRVDDFDIVLCQTEFEALTLECNLIKKHRPFYNILLKDDKHYPYLKVDQTQPFARLELARRMDARDGCKYFGPYIGASAVRQVLETLRKYFPLRTCTMVLPPNRPKRPCIHYEIGRCKAPCAGKITQEEYQKLLQGAMDFLRGDTALLEKDLTASMNEAALAYRYEEAAQYRDKLKDIRNFAQAQHAIQTREIEEDILALAADDTDAMVYLCHVRAGRMEEGQAFLMQNAGSEPPEEILAGFLTQYYDDGVLIPRNVLVQTLPQPSDALENWLRERKGTAVRLTLPRRGDKLELVRIAEKNARDSLEKYIQSERVKEQRTHQALLQLQEVLNLPGLPLRIEGYDISNTQGELSVGAMVVFENALPVPKQYRVFRIQTVEGPNDFASLAEVIKRRFTHGLKERQERIEKGLNPEGGSFSHLPDLILIDGGSEQLLYAQRAMEEVGLMIPMAALAERFEDLYIPNQEEPISLDKRGGGQLLLQHIRDEAHRFGITHHRSLRGQKEISSRLNDIPGIGPKKQIALLKHFGSVRAIFAANEEELTKVRGISPALAKAILSHS